MLVAFGLNAQKNSKQFRWVDNFTEVSARKEISIPDIMGYKTLKGDFHMHSIFSDGVVLPSERVNEAWREGLDVIALTDHSTPQAKYILADYNTAYRQALPTAHRRGITLIKGIEYTRNEPMGHLNILFANDANSYATDEWDEDQALDHAKNEGAFVIYNHPGWPDKNSELDAFHLRNIEKKNIQAVEVFNGNEFYPVAIDYCNTYGLAPFSNTDIHAPIQASYDVAKKLRNLTLVFATENTEEAIKQALFAGRTLALCNNLLAGKKEFVSALVKASLVVSKLKMDEFSFSCDITNLSDIDFVFEGPDFRRFIMPAKRTIQLNELIADAELVYQVSNTYIAADQHLEIPLFFVLNTANEVMMPFVPQNLNNIQAQTPITIHCLTDGAQVHYTLDGTTPDESSPLYASPLSVSSSAMLKIRAFKAGMQSSRVFQRQIVLSSVHQATKLKPSRNGMKYKYYEGALSTVAEIETNGKLVDEGIVEFPDLSVAKALDYFAIIYTSWLYVPASGVYTFTLESDDGAVLKLSNVELLNNDGSHSLKKVSNTIHLAKGYHPLELLYFDDYEDQQLQLSWAIPGTKNTVKIEPKYYFIP